MASAGILAESGSSRENSLNYGNMGPAIFSALERPELGDGSQPGEIAPGNFIPPYNNKDVTLTLDESMSSWGAREVVAAEAVDDSSAQQRVYGSSACRSSGGGAIDEALVRMSDACAGTLYDLYHASAIQKEHMEAEGFRTKTGFVLLRQRRGPPLLCALLLSVALFLLVCLFLNHVC
jgi:hypothetical protein